MCFVWKTDFWATLKNLLRDAVSRRKAEGAVDATKDFMLDRLDDALEPLARLLGGKLLWSEMKENALLATTGNEGGARLVAEYLAGYVDDHGLPIHLVAHSAGSILLAPLAQLIASPKSGPDKGPMADFHGFGLDIETCHLWAPACTVDLFNETYLPLLNQGRLKALALYTLSDEAERDDHCANIYHKSLLYLVSNAFEERHRIPLIRPDGEPILGMQHFVDDDGALKSAISRGLIHHVVSPNQIGTDECDAARAVHHGDFDNDVAVRLSTLNDVVGGCVVELSAQPVKTSAQFRQERAAINDELGRLN